MQGGGLENNGRVKDALRDRPEILKLIQVMFWPIRGSRLGGLRESTLFLGTTQNRYCTKRTKSDLHFLAPRIASGESLHGVE